MKQTGDACGSYTGNAPCCQQKQHQIRETAETMQDGTMVMELHLFPLCEPFSKLCFVLAL